ncbi:MAG: hypothetical protein ACRDGN_09995 [bacterium]
MENRRLGILAAMLAVLVGVAVWTQVAIAPAPAQEMMKPKMTGKITDKTIKEFTDLNIPGIAKVKYARLTFGPNASVAPMEANEGTDLCEARTGSITVTLADGKKSTSKGGDIFIIPMGLKAKNATAGPRGYDEYYWRIFPAK